jgi:hypothetical protein
MGEAYNTYTYKRNNAYKGLAHKSEGKTPLGKYRHSWNVNIKIGLKERGWDSMNVAQDRVQWPALVNTVMNLRVPLKTENLETT